MMQFTKVGRDFVQTVTLAPPPHPPMLKSAEIVGRTFRPFSMLDKVTLYMFWVDFMFFGTFPRFLSTSKSAVAQKNDQK